MYLAHVMLYKHNWDYIKLPIWITGHFLHLLLLCTFHESGAVTVSFSHRPSTSAPECLTHRRCKLNKFLTRHYLDEKDCSTTLQWYQDLCCCFLYIQNHQQLSPSSGRVNQWSSPALWFSGTHSGLPWVEAGAGRWRWSWKGPHCFTDIPCWTVTKNF